MWQSTAAAANKLALADDAVGTSAACAALASAHYRPYVVVAAAAALAPVNDVLAVAGANLGLHPSAHAHNPANTIHSPNDGLTLVLVFAGKSKVGGGEGGGGLVNPSRQLSMNTCIYVQFVHHWSAILCSGRGISIRLTQAKRTESHSKLPINPHINHFTKTVSYVTATGLYITPHFKSFECSVPCICYEHAVRLTYVATVISTVTSQSPSTQHVNHILI